MKEEIAKELATTIVVIQETLDVPLWKAIQIVLSIPAVLKEVGLKCEK